MAERLQKVMAHAGVASRRKCEKIIQQGRVKVNGQVVKELGTKVTAADRIEVDGEDIQIEEKVYFIFHKPAQVITTMSDEMNRSHVGDFFQEVEERVYPVGRLDEDTTGLLLVTNDGQLANQLMHPKFEVDKTYEALVAGYIQDHELQALCQGIELDDGWTAPAQAECLKQWTKPAQSLVKLTIHEGRNHQVKRMMEAVGHSVLKLHRSHYGPLELGTLKEGDYRPIQSDELMALRALIV